MASVEYKPTYKRDVKISPIQKEDWAKQAAALSNQDLLEDYATMSGGDDFDGGMSVEGAWVLIALAEELYSRLRKIGFLEEKDGGKSI